MRTKNTRTMKKMTDETEEIVQTYRKAGHVLSDDDCEKVFSLCERKMEIGRIKDRKSYMPILFNDELKNFLVRRFVNLVSMAIMEEQEGERYV